MKTLHQIIEEKKMEPKTVRLVLRESEEPSEEPEILIDTRDEFVDAFGEDEIQPPDAVEVEVSDAFFEEFDKVSRRYWEMYQQLRYMRDDAVEEYEKAQADEPLPRGFEAWGRYNR